MLLIFIIISVKYLSHIIIRKTRFPAPCRSRGEPPCAVLMRVRRVGIPDAARFENGQAHHQLAALADRRMNVLIDGAYVAGFDTSPASWDWRRRAWYAPSGR